MTIEKHFALRNLETNTLVHTLQMVTVIHIMLGVVERLVMVPKDGLTICHLDHLVDLVITVWHPEHVLKQVVIQDIPQRNRQTSVVFVEAMAAHATKL